MGRSFFRPDPANIVEDYQQHNTYYHEASNRHYEMVARGGRYFQRRYQLGFDGQQTNVVEKEIHYVMGSGNHARSYLHRTAFGKLLQLPVSWYSEKGGFWAMSPGYDRPAHQGFRREIGFDCFGCHSAYPPIEAGADAVWSDPRFPAELPGGIDCQRCHGPGRAHVEAASSGAAAAEIREAIVNPARLEPQRQMEICFQCHLQSTARRLPYAVVRFDRGFFSYRPGEPLADFILHFDQPGARFENRFEIDHAGYRLLLSECFRQSDGRLTCTTCHDPHVAWRGEEAARHLSAACLECHSGSLDKMVAADRHIRSDDCVSCHMPRRRTEDVVHAVMTDHRIQRRPPPGDLLAARNEPEEPGPSARLGEPRLYYPQTPNERRAEKELYSAVAQVTEQADLQDGLPRLEKLLREQPPSNAQFYYELAEAFRKTGRSEEAPAWYDEALRREIGHHPALRGKASALVDAGRLPDAQEALAELLDRNPQDAAAQADLGAIYLTRGELPQAVRMLKSAIRLNPELPEAANNLGLALLRLQQTEAAEEAFRSALRSQPDYAGARANLASLLADSGRWEEAQFEFEAALQAEPRSARLHYNYGVALLRAGQERNAGTHLEKSLQLDPDVAESHLALGQMAAQRGDLRAAEGHARDAVSLAPQSANSHFLLATALASSGQLPAAHEELRKTLQLDPDLEAAHLAMANLLAAMGRPGEARPHLDRAMRSADARLAQAAREMLDRLSQ